MKPRLILIGAGGQVGSAVHRALQDRCDVITPGRVAADLERPDTLRAVVREVRPAVIVNAAAYTSVDAAESHPELAQAVNAVAPHVLAEEAQRVSALLIHYSTDYVFGGALHRPYTESDEAAPLNVYGRTKLAGDQAVLGSGARCLVLRSGWVYTGQGRNFVSTIRRLLREGKELRIVSDQTGTPTSADQIAEATKLALAKDAEGLFHVAAHGETTWYEFAREICSLAGSTQRVTPISSEEYGAPARRPAYSVLSSAKFAEQIGPPPGPWRPELARVMAV